MNKISTIIKTKVDIKNVNAKDSACNSRYLIQIQTAAAVRKYLISIEPKTNLMNFFQSVCNANLDISIAETAFNNVKDNAINTVLSIFQFINFSSYFS